MGPYPYLLSQEIRELLSPDLAARIDVEQVNGHPPKHIVRVRLGVGFDDLQHARRETDSRMTQWAGNVTSAWLGSTMEYKSVVDGKTRRLPAALAAVHLFNHGTHHRGQLTTLMKQAGVDPGVTDLPWLPGAVTIVA